MINWDSVLEDWINSIEELYSSNKDEPLLDPNRFYVSYSCPPRSQYRVLREIIKKQEEYENELIWQCIASNEVGQSEAERILVKQGKIFNYTDIIELQDKKYWSILAPKHPEKMEDVDTRRDIISVLTSEQMAEIITGVFNKKFPIDIYFSNVPEFRRLDLEQLSYDISLPEGYQIRDIVNHSSHNDISNGFYVHFLHVLPNSQI